jgi:hypothetical protein
MIYRDFFMLASVLFTDIGLRRITDFPKKKEGNCEKTMANGRILFRNAVMMRDFFVLKYR